jgi:hypothetical protein
MEEGKKMNWKTGGKTFRVNLTIDSSGAIPRVMDSSIERDKIVKEQIESLTILETLTEDQTKTLVELKIEKTILDGILKNKDNFIIVWAEFQRWGWKLSNDILKASKVFDSASGNEHFDYQLLRENKLKCLLLDWSLKETDATLKIERVPSIVGNTPELTESCWSNIQDVDPTVLNSFLNKADLVLELNQAEEENFPKG